MTGAEMHNKMKKLIPAQKIIGLVCLLFTVGILFISFPGTVYAAQGTSKTVQSDDATGKSNGTKGDSTNIDSPGQATSAEDLSKLNIANTVSVTYTSNNGTLAGSLRILLTLTAIALAPIIIIMMTSFTRCLIVLHFTRAALGTQTAPPNQILVAMSLILTFFIMHPTIMTIYNNTIIPFENGQINQQQALDSGMKPLREFMYGQTQTKDVKMFMEISKTEWDGQLESIPSAVLVPSFMISELRTAFIIGFLIYIPFLVIDMVVASTLMAMGMMMLPPTAISMPFKILLFVLADGWNLVIGNLVRTFY